MSTICNYAFNKGSNVSLTDVQKDIMSLNDDAYFADLHNGATVKPRGKAHGDYFEFTVGTDCFREGFYIQLKSPECLVFGGLDSNDDLDVDKGEEPGNTDGAYGLSIQGRLADFVT